MRRLFLVPFVLPVLTLVACPESPPDDSCASDGERATITITLEAEGADVGDTEFNVVAYDCMDEKTEAAGVVGEAFEMEVPASAQITIEASGPWGDHDSGSVGGSCAGTLENVATAGDEAVTDVTVSMACDTLD